MSNLMNLSKRPMFYGAIILAATLISAVGANYVLAANHAGENDGAPVKDVEARLQGAVERGIVTQQQADARLEAWGKDQAERSRTRENSSEITVVTDSQ